MPGVAGSAAQTCVERIDVVAVRAGHAPATFAAAAR